MYATWGHLTWPLIGLPRPAETSERGGDGRTRRFPQTAGHAQEHVRLPLTRTRGLVFRVDLHTAGVGVDSWRRSPIITVPLLASHLWVRVNTYL